MNNIFNTPDEAVFSGQPRDNIELLKAWAGSALAYAVFQANGAILQPEFVSLLIIAAIVCGLAFVLHELAHRVVARSYGAEAHFVANNGMLIISILIAFAGFFIAAPGAVWHRGILSRKQSGLIALAGPAVNLVISALCFVVLTLTVLGVVSLPPTVAQVVYASFAFNGFLGLFNMIPAGPFDGAKVLEWNPVVFGITVAIGVVLAFGLTNQTVLNTLFSTIQRLF